MEFGEERYEGAQWHVVDGGRAIDFIHDEVCRQAAALAISEQEGDAKPIRHLWMPSA